MNYIDYIECLAEELKLNGFDVKIVQGKYNPLIEFDTIAGKIRYECAFRDNYMKDYFRFIYILGLKLSEYGLKNKNKL